MSQIPNDQHTAFETINRGWQTSLFLFIWFLSRTIFHHPVHECKLYSMSACVRRGLCALLEGEADGCIFTTCYK